MGTPGIGKSCFLDYVLHHCLYGTVGGKEKNVLFVHGTRRKVYHFQHANGGTIAVAKYALDDVVLHRIEIPPDSFDVVLYDPSDNATHHDEVHFDLFEEKEFIVAVSPDIDNCKKLKKKDAAPSGIATLYMGTLSIDEAKAMRSSCFATNVSEDLLQSRFPIIGGIPRYLFMTNFMHNVQVKGLHAGDPAVQIVTQNQERALLEIAKIPDRIDGGEIASEFNSLWSLFYLQPLQEINGTNFFLYTIELVCEDVRIRIRNVLIKKDVQDLWNLYINTQDRYGTLKGIRYEAYAHTKILAHGVSSTAVKLSSSGESRSRTGSMKQIMIPASLPRIAIPTNDLDAEFQDVVRNAGMRDTGGYLLPVKSNFPVVDSLYVPGNATDEILSLQMKAGRSRPLSGPSATLIQATVQGCLIFVVPDENIISQKLTYSDDGPTKWNQYRLVLKEDRWL